MKVSTSSLSPALERASSLYSVWICRHEVPSGLFPSAPPYRHELQTRKSFDRMLSKILILTRKCQVQSEQTRRMNPPSIPRSPPPE